MKNVKPVKMQWVTGIALAAAVLLAAGAAQAADDWDLYMLRLVNRARQNPAGEAARIGSDVTDDRAPVPPLAYQPEVGQAAVNHNTWMIANLGNIASGSAPDSFSHYETLNGLSSGAAATGTPSYTGAMLGSRITATGFSWSAAGENIATRWSTITIPVDQARIDAAHQGWWESAGHRNNMLSTSYTVFGHRAESMSFAPPLGGLPSPYDNVHFATQTFARPAGSPTTYIFGVFFDDKDGSGNWTPRNLNDALHEGRGNVPFDVYVAGTVTRVSGGTTLANGSFSVRVGNGLYDLEFDVAGGPVVIENVLVNGANRNAGDITVAGVLGAEDPELFMQCFAGPGKTPAPTGETTAQACLGMYDHDGDSDVDLRDYAAFMRSY
ncbi:MAG: CAP domain-containing protein [Phycisphaerales bacterium]|nr:CAP domain-containing protein [Phycisphaerales bacterium]